MMNTTTRHLTTLAITAMLAASAHAQPCEPEYIGTTSAIASFDIVADTLIEARERIGLEIYDVSDPNNLIKRSRLELPEAAYMNMDADGNTVLVQIDIDTAQLVDISDPDNPTLNAQISVDSLEIESVHVASHFALLLASPLQGGGPGSLQLYDISDPNNPTLLFTTPNIARYGSRIHLTPQAIITYDTNTDTRIYDLTGPIQGTPSATLTGWDVPSVQGTTVAIYKQDTLAFFDISDPSNPTQISSSPINFYSPPDSFNSGFTYFEDLIIFGEEPFQSVTSIFRAYDVSDLHNPTQLHAANINFLDARILPNAVGINGNLVHINNGLRIYDDIRTSFETSTLQTSPAWGRTLEHNGYTFGANDGRVLVGAAAPIEDLQPLAMLDLNFVQTGIYYAIDPSTVLDIRHEHLLVRIQHPWNDSENTIYSIDISDPLNPVVTDSIHDPGFTYHNNHFYSYQPGPNPELLATTVLPSGLFAPLTSTAVPGSYHSIAFDEETAYLSFADEPNDLSGFAVFSLADPLNPQLVSTLGHENDSVGGQFAARDNTLYFKHRFEPLITVELTNPPTITEHPDALPEDSQYPVIDGDNLYVYERDAGLYRVDLATTNDFSYTGPYTFDATTSRSTSGSIAYNGEIIDGRLYIKRDADVTVYDLNACASSCAADLTGDGIIDFFDVSAFLSAFNNQDPAADFTNDGTYDFFDVSAFLDAYSTGCP